MTRALPTRPSRLLRAFMLCADPGGHDLDPEAVYTEVDLALYRAKHAGRHRVACVEAGKEDG